MAGYNLLIFPIFKSLSKWRKIRYKKIIQNSKFEYGVKIKNTGNASFAGGIIRDIKLTPFKKDVDFDILSKENPKIQLLNPGDEHEIWFDRSSSPVSGPFWLNFNLEDKTKSKIISFQKLIDFNIKDEHLLQQEITNLLLISLTIIAIGISIWRLFL